jgi:hypothetical protein
MATQQPVADAEGDLSWRDDNGDFHRDDGPAIEFTDGSKMWCRHGRMHRVDGPAMTTPGSTTWAIDGNYHRDGGPAITYPEGGYRWYQHGKLHRDNGPAKLLLSGFDREFRQWSWWSHGLQHRVDGPAVINNAGEPPQWWYADRRIHDPGNVLPGLDLDVREMVMSAYVAGDNLRDLAHAVQAASRRTPVLMG